MSYISALKSFGAKAGVKLVKHLPHILVGVGIVSITAGTVEAVKKSKKLEPIIEDHEKESERIKENKKLAEEKKAIYTRKDEAEELCKLYVSTTGRIIKTMAVPIMLYSGGVVCVIAGHKMLYTRYLGVVAAYTGLQKSYSEYRRKVVEDLGVDDDLYFAHGMMPETVKVKETDENGEEHEVEKKIHRSASANELGPYAVFFDDMYSSMWTPNPIDNLATIKYYQDWYNQRLEHRKFVYYHEILRDLGIWDRLPDEKQKQLVGLGWVWGAGDNYISLGIFDTDKVIQSDALKETHMGYEPSVLIDPNLDGIVAELL